MYNTNYFHSIIPSGILQLLIECVPDHILFLPPKVIGAKIHPQTLHKVTEIIREAWCYSRVYGRAVVMAEGDDGLSFRIGRGDSSNAVSVLDTKSMYHNYGSMLYSVKNGEVTNPYHHQSIINHDVERAYCAYEKAVEDLSLRVQNSVQSMINILDNEDEDLTGGLNEFVAAKLDEQYNKSRRIYAPEGSKLTGITASVEGLEQAAETFWLHLCRTTKIPTWLLKRDPSNTSFTSEHIELQSIKIWNQYASGAYYDILRYLGMSEDAVLEPPDYINKSNLKILEDYDSQIAQRIAAAEKLILSNKIENHKLRQGIYDLGYNVEAPEQTPEAERSRSDLTKQDLTEIF